MVRKIAAAVAALLLIPAIAMARMEWKDETPALKILKTYTESISKLLTETGEHPINSLFSCFPAITVMGITEKDDAEIPEGVEITVELYYDTLNSLQLRVNNPDRFPVIAAAFLWALDPGQTSPKSALERPSQKANQVIREPQTSFEETVEELNGTRPRVYYAYYPNQYRDGVSWLQMTIIFPLEGYWDGSTLITGAEATRGPDTYSDHAADYDGYYSDDDFVHYEIFVSPTPEPDSAAAESDPG